MGPAILIFDSAEAAARACGDRMLEIIDAARRERGVASVALSGGSTPRLMFEAMVAGMAARPFDWTGVELFQVDERCVPPDHELSNFRMIRESLLDKVRLEEAQRALSRDPFCASSFEPRIHRIRGELAPEAAAAAYADEIRSTFKLAADQLPVFDLIQRGMGADGHTASLFPGEPLIGNRTGIAAAVWAAGLQQHRVTLLPGVLERARHTLGLATGAEKADALFRVMRGPHDPLRTPAQIASPETVWYTDRSAAVKL